MLSGARAASVVEAPSKPRRLAEASVRNSKSDVKQYFVYMLLCADGSYYVGVTNDVDRRVWEHNAGLSSTAYTHSRRPVQIAHTSTFSNVEEAIRWEKQLKGWSRAKKRALADGNWSGVHKIVCNERLRRSGRKRAE
jgi:putative endonuclease